MLKQYRDHLLFLYIYLKFLSIFNGYFLFYFLPNIVVLHCYAQHPTSSSLQFQAIGKHCLDATYGRPSSSTRLYNDCILCLVGWPHNNDTFAATTVTTAIYKSFWYRIGVVGWLIRRMSVVVSWVSLWPYIFLDLFFIAVVFVVFYHKPAFDD